METLKTFLSFIGAFTVLFSIAFIVWYFFSTRSVKNIIQEESENSLDGHDWGNYKNDIRNL